ncbi:hypothetical protein Q3G72_005295 [Acer saccharum]|nr:hypothetical protein Q3G72_005295 [Acer saccharum]
MLLLEKFIIDGYVKNGCVVDGLRCFMEMRSVGARVDAMMIVSVLFATGMVGVVSDDGQMRKIMKRKGVERLKLEEGKLKCLKEALVFANACGVICTTQKGAIPALPTPANAQALIKSTSK